MKSKTLIIDLGHLGIIKLESDPELVEQLDMTCFGYVYQGRVSAVQYLINPIKGQQLMQFMAEHFEAVAFREARKN